jgi:hypothetical protein
MRNIDASMPLIITEKRRYHHKWAVLNAELHAIETRDGNLLNTVERLREHQLKQGFIRDDLDAVQHRRFPHPDEATRFLSVQYNPERANRLKTSVDAVPPQRGDAVNSNCFLCATNIQWQHCGIEFGYDIELHKRHFHIWMNAYPLMPLHLVVASSEHVPQAWNLDKAGAGQFSLGQIVANLAVLSARMPGYVGFYNGDGAGTSVPEHFHYQFFKRRTVNEIFPLEQACTRALDDIESMIEGYPVEGMCWQGSDAAVVIARAAERIEHWLRTRIGLRPTLSANIFAMTDADGGRLRIYFVPRDKDLGHSPQMAGMIGSLEILGELVLTAESEKHALDRDEIDYNTIARVLGDIRVPL